MRHLLVTNDFPPKVGGIQSYLWELWRRLDPETFTVLTASSHPDAAAFDRRAAESGIVVERLPQRVLLPTPAVLRAVRSAAARHGADLVLLDPALPLGAIGPRLGVPYGVVLHGAEVTVPGRLPLSRGVLARVVAGSRIVVSAGGYPAAEARRALRRRVMPPVVNVPPGVDVARFVPLDAAERERSRLRFGLDPSVPAVVSVSRLVPRKGMDVLIDAAGELDASGCALQVAIAGSGRDRDRLAARVDEKGAPVRLLGRVDDEDLPALVGCADLFVMACRDRWLGLEQEGFGIVFLEAAACGVPQIAGDSGGAHEAVDDGVTGIVVRRPSEAGELASAIRSLLEDPERRAAMGRAARERAAASFDDDLLARRLADALASA